MATLTWRVRRPRRIEIWISCEAFWEGVGKHVFFLSKRFPKWDLRISAKTLGWSIPLYDIFPSNSLLLGPSMQPRLNLCLPWFPFSPSFYLPTFVAVSASVGLCWTTHPEACGWRQKNSDSTHKRRKIRTISNESWNDFDFRNYFLTWPQSWFIALQLVNQDFAMDASYWTGGAFSGCAPCVPWILLECKSFWGWKVQVQWIWWFCVGERCLGFRNNCCSQRVVSCILKKSPDVGCKIPKMEQL